MSTDAERLAGVIHDVLASGSHCDSPRPVGTKCIRWADHLEQAQSLIAAGVGFPAGGLDVEAAYTAAHVTVTGDSIHTTTHTLIRSPSEEAAWKAGYEYARLQSEAPAPEDV